MCPVGPTPTPEDAEDEELEEGTLTKKGRGRRGAARPPGPIIEGAPDDEEEEELPQGTVTENGGGSGGGDM